MFRLLSGIFVAVISLQWVIISFLIIQQRNQELVQELSPAAFTSDSIAQRMKPKVPVQMHKPKPTSRHPSVSTEPKYEGVAATLMINSPKWFQRRYTTMIQNILDNTPSSWAVQIFYTPQGQSQFGLDINPGILRMNATIDRIIMTPLPSDLMEKYGMKRKKLYWTSEWMWQSMVADNVFVFSGNGAVCSNSKLSLLDGSAMELFQQFDYIGTPWRHHYGQGGDGSFSYRNRTAMLNAIRYEPFDGTSGDDFYFIKVLKAMNNQDGKDNYNYTYRIATKEQTRLFAGMDVDAFSEENGPPMVIAGTLPNIDHDVRNLVLEMCPEIKRIFPSLHNPNCFGAHPNGTGCAEHICALQDPLIRGKVGC